jgi:hypothetical protein
MLNDQKMRDKYRDAELEELLNIKFITFSINQFKINTSRQHWMKLKTINDGESWIQKIIKKLEELSESCYDQCYKNDEAFYAKNEHYYDSKYYAANHFYTTRASFPKFF